jgi:hypothetical protein
VDSLEKVLEKLATMEIAVNFAKLPGLPVSIRDTVQTQHKHIPRQRNGHHPRDS